MTVVVGYLAGKCGHAPLHLAIEAAHLLETDLAVVTVVPKPWMTPSQAKVDAEFASYAKQLGDESHAEAKDYLGPLAGDLDIGYHTVHNRTAGDGLVAAIQKLDADMLVVGSSSDGGLGQVVLGSTTDWLLHASPVPVALSPRGYRRSKSGNVARVTCAYSGTSGSLRVVKRAVKLTRRLDVSLRIVSFAIRGRTMYPPRVGFDIEDSMLETWAGQLRDKLHKLKKDDVLGDDVEIAVITANGWDQALDATDWAEGEILALGSTSRRSAKGVFLGSHGAKIIRYSPVPVLVLPT
ncbi:MAG TPA: universal stress protein [Mycobacterium sp.]|nr:universal stress protein [Mycobacterium sp.]